MSTLKLAAFATLIAVGFLASAQPADAGHKHGGLRASLHVGKGLHLHAGKHLHTGKHVGLHLHKHHVHKPLHVWHDTSHWDYHPGEWVWDGCEWVYVPGHWDYHRTGHFHHLHH